jgi:hypothetical protein
MCEQDVTETVNIDIEIDNKNYFNYQSKTYFDNLDEIDVSDEHNYITDRGIKEVRRSHYKLKDEFGKDIFKFIDGIFYHDKLYITVVKKKNNKHLYYLTTEKILSIACSDCGKRRCSYSICRGSYLEKKMELNSVYISLNIEDALIEYNKK